MFINIPRKTYNKYMENERIVTKETEKKINRLFFAALIISIVVVFIFFIIGKRYFIYTDIGYDTYSLYYPYYINEVIRIRSGIFEAWNWSYGMGASITSNIIWVLDPFGILVVALGVVFGANTVKYSLALIQITKIIVAYFLTKGLVKYYLKDIYAINIAAYVSAFNGFLMLWGQHYFFGTAYVLYLAALFAIEKYISFSSKKRGLLLSVVTALIMAHSCYFGYMMFLTIGPYALYRCYKSYWIKDRKECVKVTCEGLLYVVAGIVISGIISIPSSYSLLTNSKRISATQSEFVNTVITTLRKSFDVDNLGWKLSRLISNNSLYINNKKNDSFINYYEDPQLFVSIFIIFAITFWIIYELKKIKQNKETRFEEIIKIIVFSILIFSSFAGFVYYCFVTVSYRYTFVIIPFLCICFGFFVQELRKDKRSLMWSISIGGLITLFTGIYMMINCSSEVRWYVCLIGIEIFIGIIVLAKSTNNKNGEKYYLLFIVLVLLSTTLDSFITTNYRATASRDMLPVFFEGDYILNDTEAALDWINKRDNSIYRVGKTYNDYDFQADQFFELYSTPSEYNSVVNKNIDDFYKNIYSNSCKEAPAHYWFSFVDELDNRALEITNTKYVLSKELIEKKGWTAIKTFGEINIYRNENTDSIAKIYGKTISCDEYQKLDKEKKSEVLKTTAVVDEEMEGLSENAKLTKQQLRQRTQTEITGTIEVKYNGLLMISVPLEDGWSIYVDGEKQDVIRCNYGFIGVKVPEGEHKIRVEYKIPLLREGMIVSIFGILMLFALAYYKRGEKND